MPAPGRQGKSETFCLLALSVCRVEKGCSVKGNCGAFTNMLGAQEIMHDSCGVLRLDVRSCKQKLLDKERKGVLVPN